jgi:putative acetyltransferase
MAQTVRHTQDALIIREEDPQDNGVRRAIRSINQAAFGRPDEADLIDRLRDERVILLSLIAESSQQIIGHILFTRIAIEKNGCSISAVALAPVAVQPAYQRQGIGERLIREGLDLLRERGEKIVIVVGHPNYYPRFGFSKEKAESLVSPFSKDAFMALELRVGTLDGVSGKVKYPSAFGLSSEFTKIE